MRLRLAIALAGGSLALSACAYDMYGDPYGYGYGYPYGGVSVGYYGSYGYGPYGYGYGPYGYGYGYGGYDPFGWYGNYYYPGAGIYVYDSGHNRHVWNGSQRAYWTNRTTNWQSRSGQTVSRENWSGFNRSQGMNGGWHHHNP